MRERPILFSAPMVRAILAGKKTQTRRIMKPQPHRDPNPEAGWCWAGRDSLHGFCAADLAVALANRCPHGAPAGRWRTFRDLPPDGDGWYDVMWTPTDEPRTVYLRYVADSDEPDLDRIDPTSWLWSKDERDDPEAIALDVSDPWGIAWRKPGDRLWVRETHSLITVEEVNDGVSLSLSITEAAKRVRFKATDDEPHVFRGQSSPWRPSIHMPRWASRITLAVDAVRVERLQDITDADARAEGVDWSGPQFLELEPSDDDREDPREVGYPPASGSFARDNFRRLWDRINGKRASWESNPWVWVVTFHRVQP